MGRERSASRVGIVLFISAGSPSFVFVNDISTTLIEREMGGKVEIMCILPHNIVEFA